jgi:hypothetical protein
MSNAWILRMRPMWVLLVALVSITGCGGGGGGGDSSPSRYDVTVVVSGEGSVTSTAGGIDCGSACATTVDAASEITLTAAPTANSVFQGWGGACSGTASSCTVTVNAATSVSATFAPEGAGTPQLALAMSVAGTGSVTSQPAAIACGSSCTATFAQGTTVTLTATPGAGQVFQGWGGDCSGTGLTCSVAMSAARTVSATFAATTAVGWSAVQPASGAGAWVDFDKPVLSAIDNQGRALAVWFDWQQSGPWLSLMASRYVPGTGWGTPVALAGVTSGRSYSYPVLAMDPSSGRAIVGWHQTDGTAIGTNQSIWSREFDPGTGWGATQPIQAFVSAATTNSLQVGIDASGHAAAVWLHDPDGPLPQPHGIYANRHAPGGGWGAASRISGDNGFVVEPKVVVAPSGLAVAVWRNSAGSLWSSQRSGDGAWSGANEVIVSERLRRGAFEYDVAMNAQGEALMAWRDFQSNGATDTYAVRAKRFAQGSWQASDLLVEILDASEREIQPKVALNSEGRSVILWKLRNDALRAAVGPAGQPWSLTTIKPIDGHSVTNRSPQAGIDGLGNVLVAWTQPLNRFNPDLYLNTYTPAGGWSGAVLQESLSGIDDAAASPALAMNDRGQAMLAWHRRLGSTSPDLRIVSRFFGSGR